MNLFPRLTLFLTVCGCFLSSVHAQVWRGTNDVDWFNGTNWLSGATPTGTTDVSVNINSGNMPVIGSAGATAKTINIGISAGSNATLTIENGGVLNTTSTGAATLFNMIGGGYNSDTGTGKVIVTGTGSAWNGAGTFTDVGYKGYGVLEVRDGGLVNNGSGGFRVGTVAGGTGVITVTGGTLNGSSLSVGNVVGAQASVDISNGGSATFTSSVVVRTGMTISGSNSKLTGAGVLRVGGAGTVTIDDGAVATFFNIDLGDTVGGSGLITVSGSGSRLSTTNGQGALQVVGNAGTGRLLLVDGGVAQIGDGTTGRLSLGGFNSTTADATLQIGQGGAAGILQAGSVQGQTTGTAVSRILFNHNESAYNFSAQMIGTLGLVHNGTGTTILNSSVANTFTGGTVINSGVLQIKASATNWLSSTGDITVNGGTFNLGGNSLALTTGSLTVSGGTLTNGTVNKSSGNFQAQNGSVNATLAGVAGLNKTTEGTVTLGGNNSYSGATTVTAGRLVGDHNSAFGTSAVTVNEGGRAVLAASRSMSNAFVLNGGIFEVDGTLGSGGSLSFSGAGGVLAGSGTIAKALTLTNANQILSPGNSPGIQSYTANQTWNATTYQWEINNWSGTTAGADFDQINITGSLNLLGASLSSLKLEIISLTGENEFGEVPGFLNMDRSWILLTTTGGITGFSEVNWDLLTANFASAYTGTFSIGLGNMDRDLVLNYVAVPEPGTYVFFGVGIALAAFASRRSAAQKLGFRSNKSGFSIVEVLIAVGLVAVLAALLYPAVMNASERGRDARCVVHLRQVGQAFLQCVMDSNGYFLPNKQDKYRKLLPYLGLDSEYYYQASSLTSGPFRPSVFTCPRVDILNPKKFNSAIYTVNSVLINDNAWQKDAPPANWPVTIKSVKSPGKAWTFTEGARITAAGSYIIDPLYAINGDTLAIKPSSGVNRLLWPHEGKKNFAFLDGHVESLSWDDVNRFNGAHPATLAYTEFHGLRDYNN